MFTKTGPNKAVSDEGFVVQRTARYELKYLQDDKFINIEIEPGDGLAIYKQSIKKWNTGELVSKNDFHILLYRIGEALNFLKIKYIIV